jgi:hypothetical protein
MPSVQSWFQTRIAQCFCHIFLYGSSKLMILDALEIKFEGASEYQLFFHCTCLNTCSNLDGNSDFLLKPCRWLTILIAIGQELMGTLCHACKNKSNVHSTPRVMVGDRTNYQQNKYIPKILNLWHSLPSKKKREPNECTCV